MAGHPTYIRCTPVYLARSVIEDVLVGHGRVYEIATSGVQDTFRLASRAGGVQDKQRIFRVHSLGRTIPSNGGYFLMVPEISARRPFDITACSTYHQHLVHVGARPGSNTDSLVDVVLQRYAATSTDTLVRGDEEF